MEVKRETARSMPLRKLYGRPSGCGVEVGHRSGQDGYGADRETDVAVGVLGLEEPRIQH